MQHSTRTTTTNDEQTDTEDAPVPNPSDHAHRWRIEGQAGPESRGRCACGEVKQFANSYTPEQANTYRRAQRRR